MGDLRLRADGRLIIHKRGAALTASAILLATCTACAPTPVYNLGHVPPADMARVEDACRMVARLPDGSYYDYNVCEGSLSRSLAASIRAGQIGKIRHDCMAQGKPPGSTALSLCELSEVPAAGRPFPSPPEPVAPVASVARPQQGRLALFDREKLACADIGFDPVEAAFSQCVADLDSELFAARHPSD